MRPIGCLIVFLTNTFRDFFLYEHCNLAHDMFINQINSLHFFQIIQNSKIPETSKQESYHFPFINQQTNVKFLEQIVLIKL